MSTKVKIACVIIVVMLLFTATVIGGYVYWLTQNRAGLKQSQTEGLAFGKQTNDDGCWQVALRRQKQARDYKASLQNDSFLLACLAAAANSPGFCQDVPKPLEVIVSNTWANARCAKIDLGQNECRGLLRTLQTYCNEYYKPPTAAPAAPPAKEKQQ